MQNSGLRTLITGGILPFSGCDKGCGNTADHAGNANSSGYSRRSLQSGSVKVSSRGGSRSRASVSRHRERHPGRGERALLTFRGLRKLEVLDHLVEHAVEIQLRCEMQEHAAKPDSRAIHENELTRHFDGALRLQPLVHAVDLAPAIFTRFH